MKRSTFMKRMAAFKTVDGVTEGTCTVSTDDKGSAKFSVQGNHVEMTNFAFDADPSLKVMAEIDEDEDLIYAAVLVHDGENIIQNIADGEYPETFTAKNAADQLNVIYQEVLDADDAPLTADDVTVDTGVLVASMELNDGQMFLLAGEGSNQYISIALTGNEYGAQEIVDAAFDALKTESEDE